MSVFVSAASKILGTALARVGTIGFQKALRLRRVDAALRGGRTPAPAVHTALSDFEVVIGSRYGELTEELDRFLRELERTGLVTALAEEAALNKRTVGTKKAFLQLHESIIGVQSGDGEALYDRLTTAFEASLQLLAKDSGLAFLIRSMGGEIESRIQSVSDKLAALLQTFAKEVSYEEIASTMQRVARALTSEFRNIRIETNRGAKLVELNRVYIPSKLRYRKNPALEEFIGAGLNARIRHGPVEGITYSEFRGAFRKVVVLGDPGGGKSTLCQYLCYELSKQCALQLQHPEDKEFDANNQKIPLRIILRSYERARIAQPQLSIFDYIAEELRGLINVESNEIDRCLRYILAYGRAILAFDGLDEILNTARRREFVQLVTVFCDQYPLCPVLVTSRIVGYEDAPLTNDFEELLIEKFDEDEIRSYLRKFLKVVSALTNAEAATRARLFMKQTERNARDLRQNPLLLGLMAFLFAMKGDVPSNRPEIYSECAIMMFEKWDQKRDIRADIPSGFDMLHLFSMLASEIYGRPELEEGVSESWIEGKNRVYFEDFFENRAKANEAAKLVSKFITGRSWVMSEFGPHIFRFTHRTFLEYFFARHIDENYETIPELMAVLRSKIASGEWDVISHLALQLKTHRNQRRIAQALAQLGALIRDTRMSTKRKDAVLSFTGQSLEYLPGTEQELKRIVTNVVEEGVRLVGGGRVSALRATVECCNCAPERQEFVRSVVSDVISAVIAKRGPSADIACGLVSLSDRRSRVYLVRGQLDIHLPNSVVQSVKSTVEQTLLREAQKDAFYALVYWEWYGERFAEMFGKHGFDMFIEDRRSLVMTTQIGSLLQVVLRASAPGFLYGETDLSNKAAREALALIGRAPVQATVLAERLSSQLVHLVIPGEYWQRVLKKFASDRHMFRGALITFVMVYESERRAGTDRKRQGAKPSEKPTDSPAFKRLERHIEAVIMRSGEQPGEDYAFYYDWVRYGYSLARPPSE